MGKAQVERTAKLEAKQRSLERQVRRYKRLTEGTQAPEKTAEYKAKVRGAQKRLREFVAEHGDVLRRDYWRERGPFTPEDKHGIIQPRGDGMGIDIEIDRFTPCLLDTKTGELVDTTYSLATPDELKNLKRKGWLFNWSGKDLKGSDIYKLTLRGDTEIQGLVALRDNSANYAIYLQLTESAPENRIERRYEGVGGHLFAIAAQKSLEAGYGGYVYFEAKNEQLVKHYSKAFGARLYAMPHQYSMALEEDAAQELLEIYTLYKED